MFLYADIQWTSFSAGALVGIDAGDGINHITVPGSRTSNILNIEETSNTGTPGVWMFKTGEGMSLLNANPLYVQKSVRLITVRKSLPSLNIPFKLYTPTRRNASVVMVGVVCMRVHIRM